MNLYDFMYREYGIQGRWPSPDPLDTGAFNLADPQSLDLYAYVRNSPETFVDPLGLARQYGQYACIVVSNSETGVTNIDCPLQSFYQFLQDASGSILWWKPPPPPDAFLFGLARKLEKRLRALRKRSGTPQKQTQTPQQCMSSFNNSTIGKATSFFSLLDLPSNLWDWLGFGGAKAAGVGALKAETSATVTDYSITAGTATTATTGLETVVAVGSKALGVAGSVAVVAGTAVDAQQRLVCHGLINPNDAAALGSPILPIFP